MGKSKVRAERGVREVTTPGVRRCGRACACVRQTQKNLQQIYNLAVPMNEGIRIADVGLESEKLGSALERQEMGPAW